MKTVLCLALMLSALLLFPSPRPVTGCADWDQDWVCADVDCNDANPTVGYDGDEDGDGFTVCQGDCADDDPTVHKCAESHRMYPVFYNPPEQPCQSGYILRRSRYACDPPVSGVVNCTLLWSDESPFLRDCY